MVNIKASGSACLDGLESCSDPDGVEVRPDFEGCKHGMLVGRIGLDGVKFCVGSDYSSVAQNAGRIYLAYNDSDYINNSGGYNYNIELTGSGIVEISLTWSPWEKSDDGIDRYAHYNLHMYAPAARRPGAGPLGYRSHIYMNNTNWCDTALCDNYFQPYFMESRGMAVQTIVIQPFNNGDGYFLNGQYHIFVHNTGSNAGATFKSNHAKINIYQAGEVIASFDPPVEESGQNINTEWVWYLGIVNIDNNGVANIEQINKYEGPADASIFDFSSFPPPYFDENSVIPKE
ncbi:MAG: hypothetical protein HQK67_12090 [Desulfamplus sp.]|nr:hypothetical protein [Desulfamplus sp.]